MEMDFSEQYCIGCRRKLRQAKHVNKDVNKACQQYYVYGGFVKATSK